MNDVFIWKKMKPHSTSAGANLFTIAFIRREGAINLRAMAWRSKKTLSDPPV
jgi:hypothetical protein